MLDHQNCQCSSCHKTFTDTDDIVVCPECGAPYHRACYAKEGHCVFESRHAEGFAFEMPYAKEDGARCPSCGAANNVDNIFCERCGSPLRAGAQHHEAHGFQSEHASWGHNPQQGSFSGGPFSAGARAMSGTDAPALAYDGIDTALWRAYIGRSAPYYLYQFSRMDARNRKTSICWSALFFAPMYFLYRRMWGWGVFAFLSSIILSIPSYITMFQSMGISLGFTLSASTLNSLGIVCTVLSWALSIFFSLYAFTLYRRHAAKQLLRIQQQPHSAQQQQTAAAQIGGPSVLAVIAMFVVLFGLNMLLVSWIGADRLATLLYT